MKQVLLVDDEDTLRRFLKVALQTGGFDVIEASTSADGWALAQTNPIDVLVTDVLLEDMDGPSLARHVAEIHPSVLVVFISGNPLDIEAQHRRHPHCAFLLKPFPPRALLSAIRELRKRRAADSTSEPPRRVARFRRPGRCIFNRTAMNAQTKAARLKDRLSAGETVLGCFLSLGSPLTAEMMGNAGYDWALIDLEHGAGGEADALAQLQALSCTPAAAIVRVESNARQRAHRVLDLGAHGVMFPRIDTSADAAAAAAAMRYPPEGVRGVAFSNRACEYGANLRPYLDASATALLTVVQIETREAVENVDAIAAVRGVDVLFIGPSDLSHSLGALGQFDAPAFIAAVARTVEAAHRHGKHLGILLPKPGDFDDYRELGFRFIASGSDAVLLNQAACSLVQSLRSRL